MNTLIGAAMLKALGETVLMVSVSGALATLLGVPLGGWLFFTQKSRPLGHPLLHRFLAFFTDTFRSIPFIILMVLLIPFTRLIVGTSIGTWAAMVPLTIGAIPFVARITESAFAEVPKTLIEMGQASGASHLQILRHIIISESLPNLVRGITLTLVSLVGYSAMAGAIGGGGLGDLAIRYGYQRFDTFTMLATTAILIAMVQGIQWGGDRLARTFDHR